MSGSCKCPNCDNAMKSNPSPFCAPCSASPKEDYDEMLDCVGLYCPAPVFETRKKIDSMAKGKVLLMTADDPASEDDIKALAKRTGNEIISIQKEDGIFQFLIKKT